MAQFQIRTTIPGSDRGQPLHDARILGPVAADERFEITVRVKRGTPLASLPDQGLYADQLPARRRYLARSDYAERHAAPQADLAKVAAFARDCGLVVLASDAARRSVFLSGNAAQIGQAFDTVVEYHEHDGGVYRGRSGALSVPSELAGVIEGVFGIDDRPVAKPHFQQRRQSPGIGIVAHAASAAFTPPQLARLYNFPPDQNGAGQCIGIIELGGGYRSADLNAYFAKLRLDPPQVVTVRVDGGRNQPSGVDSADGEVMLDIEVAAAIAPKARIAVYFAPNTDKGFLDALTLAIHDQVNQPSVISISWGAAEINWTAQAKSSFDQALQTAAALGVTVCVATGDNGSDDGMGDGRPHADFPASSPYALACGGSKLIASAGKISSEVVWNESTTSATGGGVSDFFDTPAYQLKAGVPLTAYPKARAGRAIPDVAGDADPATGYVVRVDGQDMVIGGTSAVAPLWAGLIALMNQRLGHPVGFINPMLYGSAHGNGAFQDIVSGNNGAFKAHPGWDACTGWGSPNGVNLLHALKG
ncbi:MAG: S53 family peptidase [Pseudomonadota bacterium]